MMKMKLKTSVQAVSVAAAMLVASIAAACPADSARPFTSGPLDAQGMFSQWVVDSNGVALGVCNDQSTTLVGSPCFFDPPVLGNALSQSLGRGVEAFMFLANSVFTTPGTSPVDAVIVMGVETAFLSSVPTAGFQTQFQRLRVRLNVSAIGDYTLETPWGTANYKVTELLAPGNGQNRAEVSVPIDVTFLADSTVPGLVSPFLVADQKPALAGLVLPNPVPGGAPIPVNPNNYIGDGITLSTVTGSPCGVNQIKLTGVDPAGNPIPINTGATPGVYTNNLFTVIGKKAPVAKVPLSITSAYYERKAGADTVVVMADGSTRATQSAGASLTVSTPSLTVTSPMLHELGTQRFYGNLGVPTPLPVGQVISVTATDVIGDPNTKTATLIDLVTINTAEAVCKSVAGVRSCVLSVSAQSSDDGSGGPVTLTLAHSNTLLDVSGAASVTSAAVPAAVTVISNKLGTATKAVTIINQ